MRSVKRENLLIVKFPEIALDWDYDQNEKPIDTVAAFSHDSAHWKCHVCGHLWEAVIGSRSSGRGCPACGGQVVIKGKNDLASQFPNIAAEWDYKQNAPVTPDEVSYGAIKKYYWLCPQCGYPYDASPNQRTSANSGCPYCSNHKVMPGFNDFATKYPELAKEWDYQGNGEKTPDKILCNHHKKVMWICPICHNSYDAYVYNRIRGDGCSYCSGHKVLAGYNDLATLMPELIKEWDYEKNGSLKPEDFTTGSNTHVWWKCEICGHRWKIGINNRTNGSRCPKCNHRNHTSFPEQAIYYYFSQQFKDAINGYSDSFEGSMELDIFIPSISVGIEYDGIRWHTEETRSREEKKYQICKDKGILLIRVSENPAAESNCDFAIPCTYRRRDYKILDQTIEQLFLVLNIPAPKIDTECDSTRILELYQTNLREESFGSQFPQYLSEWDYERNGSLTPYMFFPYSNERVWWKCSKCGNQFKREINSIAQGHKCRKCSYMERMKKKRKKVINTDTGMIFDSVADAVAYYGEVTKSKMNLIRNCCSGKGKTAIGYHWAYYEEAPITEGLSDI